MLKKQEKRFLLIQHEYRDETEYAYRIFLQSLDDIHLHSSDIYMPNNFTQTAARSFIHFLSLPHSFY